MLYPLKFAPILKDKIWGGTKLKELFNKPTTSTQLGESFELSGIKRDESVVTNGFLAGNNLTELIEVYMGELLGDKIFEEYGHDFPLLFKLIDANDDLSIQVHPNDEVASQRHDCFGKTEMWYVVDAAPNAELTVGFSKEITREEYVEAVDNGTIENLLCKVPVKKGDVFPIPAGLVHAIGSGIVIAEIQQSSDITYRIYDYKRKDDQGNERELHIEQALDVINFEKVDDPKVAYKSELNESVLLVGNEYFVTSSLRFDQPMKRSYADIESFIVYMCIEGSFDVECNGEKTTVNKGETILIPAIIDEVTLLPHAESLLLQTYVP